MGSATATSEGGATKRKAENSQAETEHEVLGESRAQRQKLDAAIYLETKKGRPSRPITSVVVCSPLPLL